MLVFSRKEGDEIRISDNVVIRVLEVSGSTARIGVEAPREVPVHRGEIWAAIQAENRRAAQGNSGSLPGLDLGKN